MVKVPALLSYAPLTLGAALLLTLSAPASAQTSSGTISGRVVDSTGQVVPGATVTLTKPSTGETRTFMSNQAGEFFFESIQPGTYNLSIDLNGFKHYEQTGLS